MKICSIVLVFLVRAVHNFDHTEEALKLVDWNADPCDNFYRHACPLRSPLFMSPNIVEVINQTYGLPSVAENFEIFNSVRRMRKVRTSSVMVISTAFERICHSGGNTSEFLNFVESFILADSDCLRCLIHLSKDSDCVRVSKHLQAMIGKFQEPLNQKMLNSFRKLGNLKYTIKLIEMNLKEGGRIEMQNLIEEIKSVALEMIEMTPWVRNHNATDLISFVTSSLTYDPDAEKQLRHVTEHVSSVNKKYVACLEHFPEIENVEKSVFCLLSIESSLGVYEDSYFFELAAAFTVYPRLGFGFTWYYLFNNSPHLAARLGSPGFTVAHEISHALIKGSAGDILTYFSQNATNCIQTQYKATCDTFKEKSCFVRDEMFEENGADVLGLQLAYTLLQKYYKGKELEPTFDIPYKTVTNPAQLFFYSVVFGLCSGEESSGFTKTGELDTHAAMNVRMNAIVNHPAFQEAFQCPDDSNMMKSRTEHCSIYGKSAPEHRRFHFAK